MLGGRLFVNRFSLYAEGKVPALRALRYGLCWIKQFNRGLFTKDIDCIYFASTPPIQGVMGGLLRNLKKVPFVYNLQDIFPDSLAGTGLAKKGGFLWKIGRVIENYTYRNADKIIVISEDFKQNIMAKGVPEEKIEVVYNWVDEKTVQPVKKEENPLFEEFGLSRDKFTIVYAGNLGNAQNISIIIDAAKQFNHNDNLNRSIQFVIFGTGGLEDELRREIEKEQLTNVRLLPLQPFERVSQVYSLGDACIVSCKAGLGGSAMPSKTWTIMSCGRPVVANFDEGELKESLEGNVNPNLNNNENRRPCGVFTKAGDLDEFVNAIKELAQNPGRCAEMGKNGRQFILDNLTREVGTRKYVDIIRSVVEKRGQD